MLVNRTSSGNEAAKASVNTQTHESVRQAARAGEIRRCTPLTSDTADCVSRLMSSGLRSAAPLGTAWETAAGAAAAGAARAAEPSDPGMRGQALCLGRPAQLAPVIAPPSGRQRRRRRVHQYTEHCKSLTLATPKIPLGAQ